MTQSWPEAPLKAITTKIGSGATPRGGKESYAAEGIALIRSMNVYDMSFNWDNLARIGDEQAKQLDNVVVQVDDVLLNITGASVARCCKVPSSALPARVNQHVAIIRGHKDKVSPLYLMYYLTSPLGKNRLLSLAQGGATREALTKGTLEEFSLPLPPLPIQRKIATVLSAYDDLIENNTRRVQVLEEMARALYREWFVEYRFPGHDTAEFVEDEHGRMPEGWERGTFSDAAVVFSTTLNPAHFPEEEFEHFSLPAFDEGQRPVVELGEMIKSSKNRVPKNCVLLPKLNPRIPRVWLPPASMGSRQIASTEFLPLLPARGYSKYWLYCLCSAPELLERLAAMASGTSSSHQRISPKGLAILPLVLPPEKVVQRFTEVVAPALELTSALRQRNANLRRTRDLLLPRLVSGELDVSALDVRGLGLEAIGAEVEEEAVA
ncbi:type I restriction enzyme S subunit [Deinococcus metalli]|uniref:Specificity protein S n=1 Tax=Deinococcus metalli TaxID=1141878 RepID=A0A7W8KKR7_9DEIO|nr:restriction endonuclease subunit S [Deinococcus metalli]MBB5379073.1 type I restriction enzyme S subunit [Deinococcus metalli]GHF64046.1 specificity protein S [Deinococcus metalli]